MATSIKFNKKIILIFSGLTLICLLLAFLIANKSKILPSQEKNIISQYSKINNAGGQIFIIKSFGKKAQVNIFKDFTDIDNLNSYITSRKKVLNEIAAANPNQKIEVVISPSTKISLSEFQDIVSRYKIDFARLSINLFKDNKWEKWWNSILHHISFKAIMT